VYPVEQSTAFSAALRQLDQQPERECLKVAVVFQNTNQVEEEEVYGNQTTNASFQQFTMSLGWPIKVATHTGFLGGLDRKGSTGEFAPYYADFSTEMIYHVAPLMPNSATNSHKKRLISKDYVLIVWSEDGVYDDNMLESMFHDVKIIITPLASGLYSVRVVRGEKMPSPTGPLQGTMIVSKYSLGPLVRQTAINAYR
jgi:hypothetical protein